MGGGRAEAGAAPLATWGWSAALSSAAALEGEEVGARVLPLPLPLPLVLRPGLAAVLEGEGEGEAAPSARSCWASSLGVCLLW